MTRSVKNVNCCLGHKANRAALIFVSLYLLAGHQYTLQDHEYEASASHGVAFTSQLSLVLIAPTHVRMAKKQVI